MNNTEIKSKTNQTITLDITSNDVRIQPQTSKQIHKKYPIKHGRKDASGSPPSARLPCPAQTVISPDFTTQNGGQPSISPPANVKISDELPPKVLASGIDTLVLAIEANWRTENLFNYLAQKKENAKKVNNSVPGILSPENDSDDWPFMIPPHGRRGYEWLLVGKEFELRILNSMEAKSRPSVMAEIRSETLWSHGPKESVLRIVNLLDGVGADILNVKPSRVDLCADIMLPSDIWKPEIADYRVTRATGVNLFFNFSALQGIRIGQGHISARLYDKPLEITQKSKKFWMFNIWGIDSAPENRKIIRVEFQLRREGIKELITGSIYELLEKSDKVWAYCTQLWLKFQTNPGKHHTQRETLPWWKEIQNGFMGIQNPNALVRIKAFKTDRKQLTAQAYGLLTSLQAVKLEERNTVKSFPVKIEHILYTFLNELIENGKDADDIIQDVDRKRSKYHRESR